MASSAVSPGGGSAAALTAASGIALLEMTAQINLEREFKKTNKKNPDATARIKKINKLRYEVIKIITSDAVIFTKLSPIFKTDRAGALYQKALIKSARQPFRICELSLLALTFGTEEILRTSRWLASDLAESALLLEASFKAGRLNVEINLNQMENKHEVTASINTLDTLEANVLKKKEVILKGLSR